MHKKKAIAQPTAVPTARPSAPEPKDPLIAAFDALAAHPEIDGEGIEMSLEYDFLAYEHGADPDWSRPRLVRHQRARKGGLTTLARHGHAHYRRMAQKRWAKDPAHTSKAPEHPPEHLPRHLPEHPPKPPGAREEMAA